MANFKYRRLPEPMARIFFAPRRVSAFTPTRGKWFHVDDPSWAGGGKTCCSACHYAYADGAFHEVYEFSFCPNCGADMRPPGEA